MEEDAIVSGGFHTDFTYQHLRTDLVSVVYLAQRDSFLCLDATGVVKLWTTRRESRRVRLAPSDLTSSGHADWRLLTIDVDPDTGLLFAHATDKSFKVFDQDLALVGTEPTAMLAVHRFLFDRRRCQIVAVGDRITVLAHHRATVKHSVFAGRAHALQEVRCILLDDASGGRWCGNAFLDEDAHHLYAVLGSGLRVFDLATGDLLRAKHDLHALPISGCLYHPQQKLVITASHDATVRFWDDDWRCVYTINGHAKAVTGLAFHPSGRGLLTASADATVRLWDLNTLREQYGHKVDHPVVRLQWLADDGNRFFCTAARTVSCCSLFPLFSFFAATRTVPIGLSRIVSSLGLSRIMAIGQDNSVRIFEPGSRALVSTVLPDPTSHHLLDVTHVAGNDTVHMLYEGGRVCSMSTHDAEGVLVHDWAQLATSMCTVVASPRALRAGAVSVSSMARQQHSGVADQRPEDLPAGEQEILALGTDEGTILFFWLPSTPLDGELSPGSPRLLCMLDAHRFAITALFFDDASRTLVTATSNSTGFWDVPSLRTKLRRALVTSSSMPQLARISTGNSTRTLPARVLSYRRTRLGSVSSVSSVPASPVAAPPPPRPPPPQPNPSGISDVELHRALLVSSNVLAIAVMGSCVFMGHEDGSTKIFDLQKYVCHVSHGEHSAAITCADRHTGLELFVSGSLDGTIKLWDQSGLVQRVIRLQIPVEALCFSGWDILVGFDTHINRIEPEYYLPASIASALVPRSATSVHLGRSTTSGNLPHSSTWSEDLTASRQSLDTGAESTAIAAAAAQHDPAPPPYQTVEVPIDPDQDPVPLGSTGNEARDKHWKQFRARAVSGGSAVPPPRQDKVWKTFRARASARVQAGLELQPEPARGLTFDDYDTKVSGKRRPREVVVVHDDADAAAVAQSDEAASPTASDASASGSASASAASDDFGIAFNSQGLLLPAASTIWMGEAADSLGSLEGIVPTTHQVMLRAQRTREKAESELVAEEEERSAAAAAAAAAASAAAAEAEAGGAADENADGPAARPQPPKGPAPARRGRLGAAAAVAAAVNIVKGVQEPVLGASAADVATPAPAPAPAEAVESRASVLPPLAARPPLQQAARPTPRPQPQTRSQPSSSKNDEALSSDLWKKLENQLKDEDMGVADDESSTTATVSHVTPPTVDPLPEMPLLDVELDNDGEPVASTVPSKRATTASSRGSRAGSAGPPLRGRIQKKPARRKRAMKQKEMVEYLDAKLEETERRREMVELEMEQDAADSVEMEDAEIEPEQAAAKPVSTRFRVHRPGHGSRTRARRRRHQGIRGYLGRQQQQLQQHQLQRVGGDATLGSAHLPPLPAAKQHRAHGPPAIKTARRPDAADAALDAEEAARRGELLPSLTVTPLKSKRAARGGPGNRGRATRALGEEASAVSSSRKALPATRPVRRQWNTDPLTFSMMFLPMHVTKRDSVTEMSIEDGLRGSRVVGQ